jgi:SPP1 gp7 family putative phage head morphogenesis protein
MPKNYVKESRVIMLDFINKMEAQDKRVYLELATKWGSVSNTLEGLIKRLAEMEVKSENQLFHEVLYRQFLKESREQVLKYSFDASKVIAENQVIFGKWGIESTQEIIDLFNVSYNRLPVSTVNAFIGRTADGSKLSDLLFKSYPDTTDAIKRVLLDSVALGRNPYKTARLMRDYMDGNFKRAVLISRTETIQVFRETSIMQMNESGVVKEWQWLAENDACPFCLDKNGKLFPLSEGFDSHPNCRCAPVPIVQ